AAGPESRGAPGGDFLRRLEREPPTGAGSSPRDDRQPPGRNTPGAIPKRLLPGQPTEPYRGREQQPGHPSRRVQVLRAAGSGPRSSGDVRVLLRKRLRVVSLFFLVLGLAVAALLHTGAIDVQSEPHRATPPEVAFLWITLGAFAALAGLLWVSK